MSRLQPFEAPAKRRSIGSRLHDHGYVLVPLRVRVGTLPELERSAMRHGPHEQTPWNVYAVPDRSVRNNRERGRSGREQRDHDTQDVGLAPADDAGRLEPRMTILAWAFTVYMIQGYLLVPFDRFESGDRDGCEAARAEAEEIGGTHEGWTVVVDAGCRVSEQARGVEATSHARTETR
jgi:hypothetical protein